MTTPAEARRIEQRSLRFGVGANAVMALAGFSAHVLTGSSALLDEIPSPTPPRAVA